MLVQKHREYEKDKKDGCFSVGKSREEIFNDLKQFCKNNPEKSIWYYVHPIRPSKENYRPEYMMDIEFGKEGCFMMFYNQAQ